MKFIVYTLFSEQFNKHYTGFTSNLEQRLKSHNELGNDWTAKYRPWKLVYTKEFETKKEAIVYEKWLKAGANISCSRIREKKINGIVNIRNIKVCFLRNGLYFTASKLPKDLGDAQIRTLPAAGLFMLSNRHV